MASIIVTDQATPRRLQTSTVPITMRVPDACRFIGISRSYLYILISRGEVEVVKLGSTTLVLTESLTSLVERRRTPSSGLGDADPDWSCDPDIATALGETR